MILPYIWFFCLFLLFIQFLYHFIMMIGVSIFSLRLFNTGKKIEIFRINNGDAEKLINIFEKNRFIVSKLFLNHGILLIREKYFIFQDSPLKFRLLMLIKNNNIFIELVYDTMSKYSIITMVLFIFLTLNIASSNAINYKLLIIILFIGLIYILLQVYLEKKAVVKYINKIKSIINL